MIATIDRMIAERDDAALNDVWRLLGGDSTLPKPSENGALLKQLVGSVCGKGDLYTAERAALAEVADAVGVDPNAYPSVEDLEDEILEAVAERIQEKLNAMSPEEQRKFFEDMVKRMSDEERIRLIDQVLDGYDQMSDEDKREFLRSLAARLGLDESELEAAIAGGAAALIPLLMADAAGFGIFIWTTQIMHAAAGLAGVKLSFAVYMMKNRALGWLLGPMGMLVTTALSAGWFAFKTWKRKERFRKLLQLISYTSSWRDANPAT